jgi:hypothetical protein
MWETTGVLRPVVEAYLGGGDLSAEQIAILRAYLRQWIGSPVWDENPHAGAEEHAWLVRMRSTVDGLTTRRAIDDWIEAAVDEGLDPL